MSFVPGNTGVASTFPDGFALASGSVTAPTLRFSDTQTGFYRVGTDSWGFASAGVQTWLVSSAGAHTIGNTANAAFPGNNIVGRKDGSAVPTGVVGETITQAITTTINSSGTAGTYTDSTETITLTPGVWRVRLNATAYLTTGPSVSAGLQPFSNIELRTTGNTLVARTYVGAYFSTSAPGAVYANPISIEEVISTSVSVTVKVSVRSNTANTTAGVNTQIIGNAGGISGSVVSDSRITAVRIA